MNDSPLGNKLGELAQQFLKRTAGEAATVRTLLQKIRGGELAALEEVQYLAHRIYGTGGTLGFEGIGEHAGRMEQLAQDARAAAKIDAATLEQMESALAAMQKAIDTTIQGKA